MGSPIIFVGCLAFGGGDGGIICGRGDGTLWRGGRGEWM